MEKCPAKVNGRINCVGTQRFDGNIIHGLDDMLPPAGCLWHPMKVKEMRWKMHFPIALFNAFFLPVDALHSLYGI